MNSNMTMILAKEDKNRKEKGGGKIFTTLTNSKRAKSIKDQEPNGNRKKTSLFSSIHNSFNHQIRWDRSFHFVTS